MAADVHAVAFVADGAGDAADLLAGLENDGDDVGTPEEFQTGGQAGRAGADDDRFLCHSRFVSPAHRLRPGLSPFDHRIRCADGWTATEVVAGFPPSYRSRGKPSWLTARMRTA